MYFARLIFSDIFWFHHEIFNVRFRYTPQLNFSAIPDGPDTDWAFWFNSVEKGAKTGKENGFSVLFDIESFDYGYYDEGSEGLKVAVVHHLDLMMTRPTYLYGEQLLVITK